MRKQKPVAMLAAGVVARSPISRLPALAERLGPVKASSYRVASRIVNTIRAGRPVHDVAAFAPSRLVLLCLPDESLAPAIAELESADLDWSGRSIVLCDSLHDTRVLGPLAARGAQVASVNVVDGLVVAEGDREAAREFRRAFLTRTTRVLRLAAGAKPLFLAGLSLAALPAHVTAGAGACFRLAGVPAGIGRRIVQSLATESVGAYTKGGAKTLEVHWSPEHWRAVLEQLASLQSSGPEVARFYAAIVFASRRLVGDLPDLPGLMSAAGLNR